MPPSAMTPFAAIQPEVRAGWAVEYAARVQEKCRLTTWDRVNAGSTRSPDAARDVQRQREGHSKGNNRLAPGTGGVNVVVNVEGRWVAVIPNDAHGPPVFC